MGTHSTRTLIYSSKLNQFTLSSWEDLCQVLNRKRQKPRSRRNRRKRLESHQHRRKRSKKPTKLQSKQRRIKETSSSSRRAEQEELEIIRNQVIHSTKRICFSKILLYNQLY